MKIYFATTNEMKLEEANDAAKEYGIEFEQLDIDYDEPADLSQQEIVLRSAKQIADETGKVVITEDTGVYFEAFNNFPGARPKFVYLGIGLKGMLKLLEGEDRKAYFLCCIGYCEPGKEAKLFEGRVDGVIDTKITPGCAPKAPYDSIFIPDGHDKPFCAIMDIKKKISHRKKAIEKLCKFLI